VLPGHLDRLVPVVRDPAGEHLEQHDAGRVDVGAGIRVPVGDQLGRHIRHRGHQLAGVVGAAGLDRAGQPEVGHLGHAVDQVGDAAAGRLGDQDVLRLHIAVHQAGPVCGGDRGEHLLEDGQRLHRIQPAALGEQVPQRAALHVLHHQVGQALVAALVVDRHHVGVGQPGDRLGLVGEPVDEMDVGRLRRVNDLQRDRTLEPFVHRRVHGRHATPGDSPGDPVSPVNRRADQRVGGHGVHRREVYVSFGWRWSRMSQLRPNG
jgi:hypothetical protein